MQLPEALLFLADSALMSGGQDGGTGEYCRVLGGEQESRGPKEDIHGGEHLDVGHWGCGQRSLSKELTC